MSESASPAERSVSRHRLPVLAAGLVIGVLIGWIATGLTGSFFGEDRESRSSQVVQSLERNEQVVLLSLGIQGIAEERVARTVFGQTVPGSGRTLFLQYGFRAKLGIEGRDVEIEPRDDDTIVITIPDFIFIGHDDITFQTALEDNGVLSWVTPDIDEPDLISQILSEQNINTHVESNRDLLEEQAESFYTGIVEAVDPDMNVVFEFAPADPTQ